jgi:small redox-active disulfide protein 2
MVIKILGSGCRNCISLEKNTKEALQVLEIESEVVKIEDFKEIMEFGVMSTPALVIDEKVVSVGKVLKPKEIVKIIEKVR